MICELCGGTSWCGRPCMHDPHKVNALLFHADGRRKTLRECGLGWDDPAPAMATPTRRPRRAAPSIVGVNKGVTKTPDVTKTSGEGFRDKRKGGRPRKADALTAAERKRRQRAKPIQFKG